jgi:hypothetical protein
MSRGEMWQAVLRMLLHIGTSCKPALSTKFLRVDHTLSTQAYGRKFWCAHRYLRYSNFHSR